MWRQRAAWRHFCFTTTTGGGGGAAQVQFHQRINLSAGSHHGGNVWQKKPPSLVIPMAMAMTSLSLHLIPCPTPCHPATAVKMKLCYIPYTSRAAPVRPLLESWHARTISTSVIFPCLQTKELTTQEGFPFNFKTYYLSTCNHVWAFWQDHYLLISWKEEPKRDMKSYIHSNHTYPSFASSYSAPTLSSHSPRSSPSYGA